MPDFTIGGLTESTDATTVGFIEVEINTPSTDSRKMTRANFLGSALADFAGLSSTGILHRTSSGLRTINSTPQGESLLLETTAAGQRTRLGLGAAALYDLTTFNSQVGSRFVGSRGDLTVSTGGDVWTLLDNSVTFQKLRPIGNAQLLGRNDTGGSGQIQQLAIGSGLRIGNNTVFAPPYIVVRSGASTLTRSLQQIDFAGSGAIVTNVGDVVTVNVLSGGGGGGGSSLVIQEEGTNVTPTRSTLNFIGANVTAADDAANNRTNVTITGSNPLSFRAFSSSAQSVTTGVLTKVALDTETFDSDNCFDSTTNYRFTPTVAGYYLVVGFVRGNGTSITIAAAVIYKNGTELVRGTQYNMSSGNSSVAHMEVVDLIYMNGSTDYLELFGSVSATSPTMGSTTASLACRLSANFVRS